MSKYYINSNTVNNEIKKQIESFIINSKLLTTIQQEELIVELNSNYKYNEEKERDHSGLIDALDYYYYTKWEKKNLNKVEFYKSVCIENAKINNEPYIVAEKSLEMFDKQFNHENNYE